MARAFGTEWASAVASPSFGDRCSAFTRSNYAMGSTAIRQCGGAGATEGEDGGRALKVPRRVESADVEWRQASIYVVSPRSAAQLDRRAMVAGSLVCVSIRSCAAFRNRSWMRLRPLSRHTFPRASLGPRLVRHACRELNEEADAPPSGREAQDLQWTERVYEFCHLHFARSFVHDRGAGGAGWA